MFDLHVFFGLMVHVNVKISHLRHQRDYVRGDSAQLKFEPAQVPIPAGAEINLVIATSSIQLQVHTVCPTG